MQKTFNEPNILGTA